VSSGNDPATVLVVDDEEEVADVYALRLRDRYEPRTDYGGEKALEALDDDVDVVLLDRRMPDLSGDDVLGEIRDSAHDPKVIMLTAVDPGMDILDLAFDDYLCKPIEKADLVAAIDQQLRVKRHDDRLAEYLEVTSKLGLLESALPEGQLANNDELARLRERSSALEAEIDGSLTEFEDIDAAFRDIARQPD